MVARSAESVKSRTRHVTLSRVGSVWIGSEVAFEANHSGTLVIPWGVPEIILLTPAGDHRYPLDAYTEEALGLAWTRGDLHGAELALPGEEALRVVNLVTGSWVKGPSLRDAANCSCKFTRDGSLWLLTQRGDDVLIRVFDDAAYMEPKAERMIHSNVAGADFRWISPAHSRDAVISIAGRARSGESVRAFVRRVGNDLHLESMSRDERFLGWTPSGSGYVLFGRRDALTFVHGKNTATRDLEELFDAVEEHAFFQIVVISETRVLIPIEGGRLFLVDVRSDGFTEVHLEGEEPQEWDGLALVGDRLVTVREFHHTLRVWDARPLLSD